LSHLRHFNLFDMRPFWAPKRNICLRFFFFFLTHRFNIALVRMISCQRSQP
jgi:hypothetical protein